MPAEIDPAQPASWWSKKRSTLGAALGAWLLSSASRRFAADTPRVGRLALERPLMGLVYLLVLRLRAPDKVAQFGSMLAEGGEPAEASREMAHPRPELGS